MMMKYYLFDMDGLLLDTEWAWEEAIVIEFDQLVPSFDRSFFDHISGKGIFDITKEFVEDHQLNHSFIELGESVIDKVIELFVSKPKCMNGAKEFVQKAKMEGNITCLVSSSPRRVIDAFISKTGMDDLFGMITGGDEVEKVKPDPSIYLKAVDKLGVNKSNIVVYEDSIPGVLAAKAAGLLTVKVNAKQTFDAGQDESYQSFIDLL
ncbi:HAD family phosphatase [Halosquirtibacter xylanolyticus]|uniref:HAD family hydrolase n=1 Tax=Halosquirtibacter xylanolyticus TaxID=3374599 RepID=UPI00374A7434|nr:HAD family phosphatase [Prolixibacteraceae bacterium]